MWSKEFVKEQAKKMWAKGPSYPSKEYYEFIIVEVLGGMGQDVKGFLEGNSYEDFKLEDKSKKK